MRAQLPAALIALSLLGSAPLLAQDQRDRPSVKAVAASSDITLDGRFDEAAWLAATPATDFVQYDPSNGSPATQRTEVRFVYAADALYIAARMYDTEGARGVMTQLARRDGQSDGDNILFVLDTYHDHSGRALLQINPSGVKFDAGQASPAADPSWDPIWQAATAIDSLGWTAELRIPFSQLRFPRSQVQTWGMQIWRFTQRLNETSMWAHWTKTDPGGPPQFGHLEDLHVPGRQLGVELMPYAVGAAEPPRLTGSPDDEHDRRYAWRFGGDVKALISSSLTLDATINPDFGQVEVDPAVVNLSAFETFFPEKRPFFVANSGLFNFGSFNCFFCSNVSSLSLFYSRRIGRQPQGFLSAFGDHVERPDNATILGAAKLTGRTGSGYQLGVLNAVTASERATADDIDGNRYSQEVEPLTNYFVARARRTTNNGNLTVGAMGTSVIRRFDSDNPTLEQTIPHHAEAAGVDWDVSWANRAYNFMGSIALSQVSGDTTTINALQRSSARYYHRPDRGDRSGGFLTDEYNPTLTSMRGLGFYSRVARQSGDWVWEAAVNGRTPGFEVNDIAFLQRTDYTWMNTNVQRQFTEPTSWYRDASVLAGIQQQLNFDGDVTDRQWRLSANAQFRNFWNAGGFLIRKNTTDSDNLTRGGPVVRDYGWWFASANVNTDSRRRIVLGFSPEYGRGIEGSKTVNARLNATFKPAPSVLLSVSPAWNYDESRAQFVQRFADPVATDFFGQRVIFSDISTTNVSLETRLAATFTPTLSLELFAQPFIASGDYSGFKEFVRPRGLTKRAFDSGQIQAVTDADGRVVSYSLDPDRDSETQNFTFDNPDFNVRSLRGNAVLRWEYRPGSTLFLVWQQERAGGAGVGDFDLDRDTNRLFDARPESTFMVKLSYWLGR